MIDPQETVQLVSTKGENEPWNGEFYVSFGQGERRDWEDARRYGFISAGGGTWYSNTLNMLAEGDRVWVNIPRTGYVGVGIVTGERQRLDTFRVDGKPLTELDTRMDYQRFADESLPLDGACSCPACKNYSRAYLHHVVKAGEIIASMLLTWHNLTFYQDLMADLRQAIAEGRAEKFASAFLRDYSVPDV